MEQIGLRLIGKRDFLPSARKIRGRIVNQGAKSGSVIWETGNYLNGIQLTYFRTRRSSEVGYGDGGWQRCNCLHPFAKKVWCLSGTFWTHSQKKFASLALFFRWRYLQCPLELSQFTLFSCAKKTTPWFTVCQVFFWFCNREDAC